MNKTKIDYNDWAGLIAKTAHVSETKGILLFVKEFVEKNKRPATYKDIYDRFFSFCGGNCKRLVHRRELLRVGVGRYIPGPNA